MGDGTSAGLRRKLGLFPLTNVVIANMIGTGIFTTSGLLMSDLGSPLLLLTLWAVGGILALCGALSYGMLGAAIPLSGGEYAFLSRMYHPLLGFLGGWTSFIVGFSAPIAASAIGFSEYFFRAFPRPLSGGDPAVLKKALSMSTDDVIKTVRREEPKVGRNDPCPCGSGKKYKKCHGAAA